MKNESPLNNGQNFGNRECPLFRGFTVYIYIYVQVMAIVADVEMN